MYYDDIAITKTNLITLRHHSIAHRHHIHYMDKSQRQGQATSNDGWLWKDFVITIWQTERSLLLSNPGRQKEILLEHSAFEHEAERLDPVVLLRQRYAPQDSGTTTQKVRLDSNHLE